MLSFVALILFALLMLVLVIGFAWALRRNLRQSALYRTKLLRRLNKLRLNKAMSVFGINVSKYLHSNAAVDIENHMRNCSACKVTKQCDIYLCQDLPASDFRFCPNYQELVEISAQSQA